MLLRPAAFLLVAAGKGLRAGSADRDVLPKQYRPVAGRSAVARCLDLAFGHPGLSLIQPVIAAGDEPLFEMESRRVEPAASGRLLAPVAGGASRQGSVKAGLEALAKQEFSGIVLVHDAARAFCDAALIDRALAAGAGHVAAVPALPLIDTVKQVDASGRITGTPDRAVLRNVQTPQVFDFAALCAAHAKAAAEGLESFTDDGGVMEWAGHAVTTFEGDPANIKLTTQEDFAMAEARLAARASDVPLRVVVAQGYDVHRFAPGDHVWLGGVKIAHSQGVEAHSDGDVILHALTDALLGALGDGDIGVHFPPSDMHWRGASSDQFLAFAVQRVAARGGRISHLDVTLVCEAPRIGPHRDAIIARISGVAGLAPTQVGLKATTSERMGFTGRGEGLAALAIATVLLPEAANA
jgi:2-C-methyl-D-erythritol 4-phosphate cytidylyltransferase/2-C-methyl-D-erythritol 2,4-cyclodiphosphate synthase